MTSKTTNWISGILNVYRLTEIISKFYAFIYEYYVIDNPPRNLWCLRLPYTFIIVISILHKVLRRIKSGDKKTAQY